jgi:glycosyltransferase involved in cell wall biosynthesis
MKILYSCLSKSWGGMEMVTINSIKQLLDKGTSVELLCTAESRIHIEANNLGMIIYPVKAPGYLHPLLTLKIVSIFKNGKYDLIHTHASKDLWLLVPALKAGRFKTPLILTKHVGSFINKRDKAHNWLYNRVNCAIAISNVIKSNLIDTTSLTESKIFLHYNGIDTCRFNPENLDPKKIRGEFDIKDNELLMGMVARYSSGKGHELFLEAAKQLSDKYDNLKFIMIGEASKGEDYYANTIKQLAKKQNLNNIILAGFRSDMPEVLSALDIFVFPSQSEAFGVALTEAMAMAKPSVSTNSDGVLDITIDNETGFLFEKNNVNDLISKLEILINSLTKRKEFGIAARNRVLQNFNSENQMNKLIDLYLRLT